MVHKMVASVRLSTSARKGGALGDFSKCMPKCNMLMGYNPKKQVAENNTY